MPQLDNRRPTRRRSGCGDSDGFICSINRFKKVNCEGEKRGSPLPPFQICDSCAMLRRAHSPAC